MTRKYQKGLPRHEAGQAVLVVLLSLSVVLIIVLFILSRSITDLSLSTKEEDSLRAFSAAEAGVERALIAGSTGNLTIGDANFSATVAEFAEGSTEVIYPISLYSGENAIFWFSRPNSLGFTGSQFKVCWADSGTSNSDATTPALEITVVYRTTVGEYRVARKMLDPNTSGRTSSNGYVAAGTCTVSGQIFQFQNTVTFDASGLNIANYATDGVLQYATAKLLYNTATAHKVAIDITGTGSVLPSQGALVDSKGNFGDANRRIEVYQLHPETPPIFANAIFSSGSIIK